jgi:hypothetical protein
MLDTASVLLRCPSHTVFIVLFARRLASDTECPVDGVPPGQTFYGESVGLTHTNARGLSRTWSGNFLSNNFFLVFKHDLIIITSQARPHWHGICIYLVRKRRQPATPLTAHLTMEIRQ